MRRRARRARGFTLLETVIALGLFAVLIATVQATLFTGNKMFARLAASSTRATDVLVARRVLERWLSALTMVSATPDPAHPSLSGRSDRFIFHAVIDRDGSGIVEIWVVELALTDGPGGPASRLVMTRRPLLGTQEGERSILLDWQSAMAFAYGLEATGAPLRWTDDLGPAGTIPGRVRLATERGPLLTARVALQDNGRCLSVGNTDTVNEGSCRLR